jgi:outer membrane protein TolC
LSTEGIGRLDQLIGSIFMRYHLLAPLLVALPGTAFAGPLTYDAALRQAQSAAPSIKARVLGVDAARSARAGAGSLPDPTLALGFDSFPVSGPLAFAPDRDDFSMARIGVSQTFPNLAKRHAEQHRADTNIRAAEADGAVEARNVAIATALAWINLAYAERRLTTLDGLRVRLESIVGTTREAVTSGNARPAQTWWASRLSLCWRIAGQSLSRRWRGPRQCCRAGREKMIRKFPDRSPTLPLTAQP